MTPGDLSHGTAAPPLTVFFSVAQDRPAVSHRPLLQLGSAWFSSSLMVRPRPPTLRQASRSDSVLRLYRSSPLLSIRTGMLHSNPGDYAWGQGGLDAVITQVRRHKFQGVVSQFENKKGTSILFHLYFHQPSPTLCLCSYLVSWKTQDPHRQKKRRSLPSQLSVSLRNKQVSASVLSPPLGSSLSSSRPLHFPYSPL